MLNGTEVQFPRRIELTEVAKLLRSDLKRAFPGVRFAVRCRRFAGGTAVEVVWTDGPPSPAVDALLAGYAGARFDSMHDLRHGAKTWYCPTHGTRVAEVYGHPYDNGPVMSRCCAQAELVHMDASFVQGYREVSAERAALIRSRFEALYGVPYEARDDWHIKCFREIDAARWSEEAGR